MIIFNFTRTRFQFHRIALVAGGFVAISLTAGLASADMWKCTPKDTMIPVFTETPSFGDDVECIQITGSKFSKPGGGGADPKQKANKNNRNSPEQLRMRADAQKRKKDEAIRSALSKKKK